MDLKRKVSTFQRYISHSSMGWGDDTHHILSRNPLRTPPSQHALHDPSGNSNPPPAVPPSDNWQWVQASIACSRWLHALLQTFSIHCLLVYQSIMLEWDLMADKHLYSTHPMIKYVEMQTTWNKGMPCKHTLSALLNHDYIAISR